MNEHIKLILFFANLILGSLYLVYVSNLKKIHKLPYIKWLFISAIIFNSFLLFTFITKYWVTNVLGILDYHKYFYIRDYIGVIINFCLFSINFVIISKISGINLSGYLKSFFATGIVLLASILFSYEIFIKDTSYGNLLLNLLSVIEISYSPIVLTVLLILAFVNIRNKYCEPVYIRKSFSAFLIVPQIYTIIFIGLKFFYFETIDKNIFAFLGMLNLINLNLFPLLWLKYSFSEYYKTNSIAIQTKIDWGKFVSKYKITKREIEITQLIIEGKSNKEIEEKLFLSMHTVKNHLYNIYKKLNVSSRTQLINIILGSN